MLREVEASSSTSMEEEDQTKTEKKILDVFRAIEGPFAFVYWFEKGQKIFFGRDRLGRRSLMMKRDGRTGKVVLSSVVELNGGADDANGNTNGSSNGWKEVEADGIYVLDLSLLPSSGTVLEPVRRDWIEGVDPAEFVSTSRCHL